MELRQLKYFIQAAELQNFTNAAAALFITQSTLSQQIKQLEDELGIPLFDRVAKRVRLTEAGNTFLPYAKKTVKDAMDGREVLTDLMNLNTGALHIGLTYGLSELLAKAVTGFSAEYPGIRLNISFGTTTELLEQMEAGGLDMMLSFYESNGNDGLTTDGLFVSHLSLIASSKHAIARRKSVNIRELATLPLMLPSKGYSIRSYLDKVLKEHELAPMPVMEINDIHTLLKLVDLGGWVTVLMSSTIVDQTQLRAVKLTGADMARRATVTWPKDAYRKKAAALLVGFLLLHSAAYGDKPT
ncbi:LysR substrate-binding domain-containing protein [Dyadobacter sp. MSC1_007]|jgi:LysR family cyn operon transcriptional activator|uniref:LysR substrate-binding domain-containing protein n=1 Tax=Dyadobacter sp. MSC1_007 TaxID=2909264 RepID=UPI002030E4F9|nr:LysR substrate-binding domain-containing protein [Dyadobacter sp. MSC1_007]